MEGVTTAIVAFIFLGLVLPSLVQNKNQYYVAFIAVIGIIFFEAVAHIATGGLSAFFYMLTAVLQVIAVVMLFLATGGLTFRALRGDMIEVLRRGEEEKEVIIPLSEQAKQKIRANQEEAARRPKKDAPEPKVFKIDDPAPVPPPPREPPPREPPPREPPPREPPSTGSLPLD
jgi:hypothetical protein